MRLRTTTTAFALLACALTHAEHQNNAYMMNQAMNGDKNAQMMMMMGGGGGGGGGGGDAKYESKREELQKAIEQPAKETRKAADERDKAFTTLNDKLLAETTKSFIANTPKDEKIDEKMAAQISAPPPSNTKMVQESTNELIASTKANSDAAVAAATSQSRIFLNAAPQVEEQTNTMERRLGWTQASNRSSTGGGLGAATQARTPASQGASENPALNHTPGANGGAAIPPTDARGFGSGLIHNLPKGF